MVEVRLLKPGKATTIAFEADLLRQERHEIVVRAFWRRGRLDLGYVVFEDGDRFLEHYYTDRWYNIYAIYSAAGAFKGWYCNVTKPASYDGQIITSEDLEIDLFVSPDRSTILTLDMDEFAARGFDQSEPATHWHALEALAELEQLALAGAGPFSQEERADG